jgi:hypothetical protein
MAGENGEVQTPPCAQFFSYANCGEWNTHLWLIPAILLVQL